MILYNVFNYIRIIEELSVLFNYLFVIFYNILWKNLNKLFDQPNKRHVHHWKPLSDKKKVILNIVTA